ncbi:uncharacterized protein LOC134251563 [Saccostrea cucullata]|uniref:uncharacterized protein LOC134251563 n=1 Tax=Saccostrea cuccullata TaxID=36930 RepID=UPI002ED3C2CC
MTKKKSSLWLHQPKKRKLQNTSSPNKWKWTADLLLTPSKTRCYSKSPTPKKLKVHRVFQCNQTRGPPSPLKITPKRQRVDKFSEKQQFSEIEYHKICTADKGTQTHDENSKTISEDLFSKAFEKLFKYDKGIANEVLTFLRLVAEEKYPKDNIAFLLFLDTVRFCNCDISSKMCYRPETKRFWKIGYKLFHSKFLYFMGGPKNACQIKDGVATRGKMSTESSQINFVVPSAGVLSQFNVSNVDLNETLQPGILHPVLDALQVQEESEFMLCADAKKVTAGVDQIGGDVNMFGHEDGYSFFQRNKTFTDEIQNVNEIKNGLTNKMSFPGSLTDDEKQETLGAQVSLIFMLEFLVVTQGPRTCI